MTEIIVIVGPTDVTQGESGGSNREVYMTKHNELYIRERTKQ